MSFRTFDRASGPSRLLIAMVAVILVTGLGLSSAARAAIFTVVNPPPFPEKNTSEILSHIYGGNFTQAGLDYTNGVITAHRIADGAGSGRSMRPLNLFENDLPGNPGGGLDTDPPVDTTDQLWTADSVVATAQARYALYSQRFGFFDGTSGGSYIPIFDVTGSDFNVSGAGSIANLGGHTWRWARAGTNFAPFTSQNSDNPLSVDHMVTYRIDFSSSGLGSTTVTTYLLFWEDKAPNDNPDYDYNDLVVEIRASRTDVPEPASALGAAGILAAAAMRRRRN
jgi:MYXO-CTERM domain-containing protein